MKALHRRKRFRWRMQHDSMQCGAACLRITMKVNISMVSNFFLKLLRLPMSFFDTKLLGDLLQRTGDHGRTSVRPTHPARNHYSFERSGIVVQMW